MTLDDVMESICDRCRYVLEAQEQTELDDICAACTIPADIEELVRQETGPHGGGDRHLCGGELSGDPDGPPGIKKGPLRSRHSVRGKISTTISTPL